MKIIFMGSSNFAIPSLEYLHRHHEVLCIYTKPSKPANRGMALTKTDSEIFAINNNIEFRTPNKFDAEEIEYLESLQADFIIVASYGMILQEAALKAAKYPALNLHGSLLPHWRGASPIQYSILNGDLETGITLQVMSKKVDAGDILLQESVKLDLTETHASLMDILGKLGPITLNKFLNNYEQYLITRTPQNHSMATFAPKINKQEFEINFKDMDALTIERKIRAYNGNCWTNIGGKRIKLLSAEIINHHSENIDHSNNANGQIIDKDFSIKTNNGIIRLLQIKPEDKKAMLAKDFLNGNKHLMQ